MGSLSGVGDTIFAILIPTIFGSIAAYMGQAGNPVGVVVTLGGQTPLKLARALEEAGVPIMGTSPDAIDLAEDRDRFAALLDVYKRQLVATYLGATRRVLLSACRPTRIYTFGIRRC